jgi:hypothetical protein
MDAEVPEPVAAAAVPEPVAAAAEEAAEVLAAEVVTVVVEGVAALSVRPEPQAATDAARVRAPAAAMNRRDVVLRMEPLSAGPLDRLGKRRSEPELPNAPAGWDAQGPDGYRPAIFGPYRQSILTRRPLGHVWETLGRPRRAARGKDRLGKFGAPGRRSQRIHPRGRRLGGKIAR